MHVSLVNPTNFDEKIKDMYDAIVKKLKILQILGVNKV
jgi:hypothetical protein